MIKYFIYFLLYSLFHAIAYRERLHPEDLLVFWLIVLIVIFGALCWLAVVWIKKPSKSFIRDTKNRQTHKRKKVSKPSAYVLSMEDARKIFPNVIAETEVMRGVLGQVSKIAPTDSTVLVLGENGTGKELIATCIHEHSKRKDGPFIKINCGAIPDGLWDAELFGYLKGCFTGVSLPKKGKFELADGGTIFLDEIRDMPTNTQTKMLRVLQEREIVRLGSDKPVKVDVRIIAATNKNLEQMVKEGLFREDLFFRLNVFTIALPPLRERREDIPALVDYFCKKGNVAITPLAKQMLRDKYNWPGNVKELENAVERAIALCDNDIIEPQHLPDLPDKIIGDDLVMPAIPEKDNLSIDEQLRKIEKAMIMDALIKTKGIQSEAVKLLKIKERALWHRIKKFQIELQHLPNKIIGDELVMPAIPEAASGENEEGAKEDNLSIDEQLREIEKTIIMDALKKTKGVQVQAAELLKIKERALWHRIKKFQIDVKQFKEK